MGFKKTPHIVDQSRGGGGGWETTMGQEAKEWQSVKPLSKSTTDSLLYSACSKQAQQLLLSLSMLLYICILKWAYTHFGTEFSLSAWHTPSI